jgi:ribosomal protein S18 acetylase RimI-like enzyme
LDVNVRRATQSDRESLHALYREFFAEWPPPVYYGVELEAELAEVDEILEGEFAFVAEEEGELVGFALGRRKEGTRGLLSDIYLRPAARRRGLGTELTRAVVDALRETGATHVTLSVDPRNESARAAYARWGFREQALTLVAEVEELERGLGEAEPGPSFGSVHVQTDDGVAVARAVRQFLPRLPGRSEGTVVAPPRNGWVAVYDELCDREPELLRRLARELSDRMGAVVLAIGVEHGRVVRYLLYERARMVDEYLSVPEHYGQLPPGDVIALGANPTVVARLTGADPKEVRSVARTAASPADLPPPLELLARIARAMRIEGAEHGYDEAVGIPDAERIGPD